MKNKCCVKVYAEIIHVCVGVHVRPYPPFLPTQMLWHPINSVFTARLANAYLLQNHSISLRVLGFCLANTTQPYATNVPFFSIGTLQWGHRFELSLTYLSLASAH